MSSNPHPGGPTNPSSLLVIVVLLLAMAAVAGAVWLRAVDARGTEIVRFRNALTAEAGTVEDFTWVPLHTPTTFAQEHASVPTSLTTWPGLARGGDALTRALAIVRALSGKPRSGARIARSTLVTLTAIEIAGAGYCADYAKVFNALAYAAGIPVRQWGFTFDRFGGYGHTFNEIWDADAERWIMIDAFNGFYPRDATTRMPLSALAFRERLQTSTDTIHWERITPTYFGFTDDAAALRYFQRGVDDWYLVWGNNALAYDQQPLVALASLAGRFPEQVTALLTGVLPRLKVRLTEDNRQAFEELMQLKRYLLGAAAIELVLLLTVVWRTIVLVRSRACRRPAFVEMTAVEDRGPGVIADAADRGAQS